MPRNGSTRIAMTNLPDRVLNALSDEGFYLSGDRSLDGGRVEHTFTAITAVDKRKIVIIEQEADNASLQTM